MPPGTTSRRSHGASIGLRCGLLLTTRRDERDQSAIGSARRATHSVRTAVADIHCRHRAPARSGATGSTNGKPVARRGRKATGLDSSQSAGLPNQGGISHAGRFCHRLGRSPRRERRTPGAADRRDHRRAGSRSRRPRATPGGANKVFAAKGGKGAAAAATASSIRLDQAGDAALSLGSRVTFTTDVDGLTGNEYALVYLKCVQGDDVVYGQLDTPEATFVLGGESSPWRGVGGEATCVGYLKAYGSHGGMDTIRNAREDGLVFGQLTVRRPFIEPARGPWPGRVSCSARNALRATRARIIASRYPLLRRRGRIFWSLVGSQDSTASTAAPGRAAGTAPAGT